MLKRPTWPTGTVHRLPLDSRVLVGNRPGDPTRRDVLVYTPPGFDPARRYPLLVDLIGYTGSGASHTNWRPFGQNLPERLDRLYAEGRIGPMIVALPDCFTAYGGNQYIDSAGTGRYMTHLVDELVPFVEANFPILPGRDHRGVFGKSSGGYGAFVHGMLRPDVWGAIASHSGDAGFDYLFLPAFPRLLRRLLEHDGDVTKLLAALHAREKFTGDDIDHLMTIGMAAHFDGDPEAPLGFHLPFQWPSGRLVPERWERWLAWDPARLVDAHAEALATLRGMYFDCGRKDQYHLLWGNRQVHASLEARGVAHRYEEFDDDHSDVDYRMDVSLPWLWETLKA
ncbi:MAG: alpha/beta hydrolase-fold protein [Pseudomonadota bacterium]|nr:alpha/beta hydrolase-fold protein [Pseudomonadota bacterium]